MIEIEESAKTAGVGKWSSPDQIASHVRNIVWNIESPRNFVESFHYKPVTGI